MERGAEKPVTAKESLNPDYGRLAGFLRGISLRFQLLTALEFLLLLPSGILVVLLSSFFVFELKSLFPYLPFIYSLASILILFCLLFMAIWRTASRPSMEGVARKMSPVVLDKGMVDKVAESKHWRNYRPGIRHCRNRFR